MYYIYTKQHYTGNVQVKTETVLASKKSKTYFCIKSILTEVDNRTWFVKKIHSFLHLQIP